MNNKWAIVICIFYIFPVITHSKYLQQVSGPIGEPMSSPYMIQKAVYNPKRSAFVGSMQGGNAKNSMLYDLMSAPFGQSSAPKKFISSMQQFVPKPNPLRGDIRKDHYMALQSRYTPITQVKIKQIPRSSASYTDSIASAGYTATNPSSHLSYAANQTPKPASNVAAVRFPQLKPVSFDENQKNSFSDFTGALENYDLKAISNQDLYDLPNINPSVLTGPSNKKSGSSGYSSTSSNYGGSSYGSSDSSNYGSSSGSSYGSQSSGSGYGQASPASSSSYGGQSSSYSGQSEGSGHGSSGSGYSRQSQSSSYGSGYSGSSYGSQSSSSSYEGQPKSSSYGGQSGGSTYVGSGYSAPVQNSGYVQSGGYSDSSSSTSDSGSGGNSQTPYITAYPVENSFGAAVHSSYQNSGSPSAYFSNSNPLSETTSSDSDYSSSDQSTRYESQSYGGSTSSKSYATAPISSSYSQGVSTSSQSYQIPSPEYSNPAYSQTYLADTSYDNYVKPQSTQTYTSSQAYNQPASQYSQNSESYPSSGSYSQSSSGYSSQSQSFTSEAPSYSEQSYSAPNYPSTPYTSPQTTYTSQTQGNSLQSYESKSTNRYENDYYSDPDCKDSSHEYASGSQAVSKPLSPAYSGYSAIQTSKYPGTPTTASSTSQNYSDSEELDPAKLDLKIVHLPVSVLKKLVGNHEMAMPNY